MRPTGSSVDVGGSGVGAPAVLGYEQGGDAEEEHDPGEDGERVVEQAGGGEFGSACGGLGVFVGDRGLQLPLGDGDVVPVGGEGARGIAL